MCLRPFRSVRLARARLLRMAIFVLLLPLITVSLQSCSKGGNQDELWIIGLDGADWDILEPYMNRGLMPNLTQLRREGAWGVLRSDKPMLSPILWTSMATGKTADIHGVTWFMTETENGDMIPVSSRDRRVRALWNIASEQKVSVGFIGWWATWPAEPVRGFMISDYLAYHSFNVTGKDIDVPGKTYPEDLSDLALRFFPRPEDIGPGLLGRMIHLPPDQLAYEPSTTPYGTPIQHLRQAIATSQGYTELAKELLHRERPRLFSVYYEGTDATEHLFSPHAPPRQTWISDEDFTAYSDALAQYWRWQDELLGELLALRDDGTTIMIVSDHGFRWENERLKEEVVTIETADRSHMLDGIVVLNGPPVRPGGQIHDADIFDVAPTVLYLLGLPVAEDFAGEIMLDALSSEYTAAHPVRTVATFETGPWDRGEEIVVDPAAGENLREMLTSLGYIGDTAPSDAEPTQGHHNIEQAVNMAVILRNQHRYDEAVDILTGLLEDVPDHVMARFNLGLTYGHMGRLEDAVRIFRSLVRDEPQELRNRENLVRALQLMNKHQDALQVLQEGLTDNPTWARGLSGKGFSLYRLGRFEDAARALDESLRLDPRIAKTHYYRGLVLIALGRVDEARQSLERALKLEPDQVMAEERLIGLLLDNGEAAEAQTMMEHAVAQGRGSPWILRNLGRIYLNSGRTTDALPLLEKALPAFERDTELLGTLGMAYAATGNLNRAAEYFEKILLYNPQNAEAMAQLGTFYMQMNRMNDAERLLKHAVAGDNRNANLYMALGAFYQTTNRLPQAEIEYKRAVELDPQCAQCHMRLAMLYQQMQKADLARQHYDRAMAIDPGIEQRMGRHDPGQASSGKTRAQ